MGATVAVAVAVTVVVVVVVTWLETMVVIAINPTEASDDQYEMRMIYVRDKRRAQARGKCVLREPAGEMCALAEGRRTEPVHSRKEKEDKILGGE